VKFTAGSRDLAGAVAHAARALPQITGTPVLAGIRLQADSGEGTVTAAAYSGDLAATATIGAQVAEAGVTLVSGRLLAAVTAGFDGDRVDAEDDGGRLMLRCGTSTFGLTPMPPGDYPDLPPVPAITGTCDPGVLARAAARVLPAASRDDTLETLTGVKIDTAPDVLTLTATDRYRAAVAVVPWQAGGPGADGITALVPASVLAAVTRDIGDGQVAIGLDQGGTAGFATTGRTMVTRLIAREYPQMGRFFDKTWTTTVEAEAAPLLAAVRRAALAAPKGTAGHVISLAVSDSSVIIEAEGEAGADSELIEVKVDGDPVSTAFDSHRLADALTAAGDRIHIRFAEPGPVLFTPADDGDDYRHVLMPHRR
jgi:DNA polymerase-3 subunit beta